MRVTLEEISDLGVFTDGRLRYLHHREEFVKMLLAKLRSCHQSWLYHRCLMK
jgi:hypothetical protein